MSRFVLEEWQREVVETSRVARLATVTARGAPHLVPVCFTLFEGGLAIPVDEKPKSTTGLARLRNIAHEPRVALLFDRYDDDWTRLAWVRIDGKAAVVARGESGPGALAALRERYAPYRQMALESLPLIVVEPLKASGWRWTGG